MCNRSMSATRNLKTNSNERRVYERNMRLIKKTGGSLSPTDLGGQVSVNGTSLDELEQQQQQLLQNKADLIMQSQMMAHLSCSNSSNSTLLKQQQQQHNLQRTPSHLNNNHHHHPHQPLIISNPNHSIMQNAPLTNNSQAITEMEFYSNVNHHTCYNQEFSYSSEPHNGEDVMNSAQTAAALAFSAPYANLNGNSNNNSNNFSSNEPIFLRHTIRPKPIAIQMQQSSNQIQMSAVNSMDQQQQSQQQQQQSNIFNSSHSSRKSLKNLRQYYY